MSLCIQCGKILEHAKGCSQAAPDAFDTTPQARNARTLRALEEVQARLKELKPLAGSNPREAAKLVFTLEQLLEKHPSGDLTSFEHKRNWKAAEDQLKKCKEEASGGLGDKAEQLFLDLAFARKALELLHAVHVRRKETAALDLEELTRVPDLGFDPKENPDPTDPASIPRAASEAIERRLATTANVDNEVDAWGKNYLEPLAAGDSPREFPAHIKKATSTPLGIIVGGVVLTAAGAGVALGAGQQAAGGGVGALGLIVRGARVVTFMKAAALQRSAPATFAALSQKFRDRLYLVCVLRSLRGVLSGLSKAEEAFRTHTGGTENAARWKRIKTQEKDLVKSLAGEWDEKHSVDDEMARRIAAAGMTVKESIRPPKDLTKDDWDGLAKAYQAERREDSESSDETRLAILAEVVLAHASAKPDHQALRRKAITEARNSYAGRVTEKLSASKM